MSAEPTFRHDDPGTPESTWLLDPRWADRPLVDVAAVARRHDVLVVSAHPDDETLAVGGLLAALHRVGAEVRVYVATAGEHSHPDATVWRPDDLAEVRVREVAEAVARLAPHASVEQRGHPDGGLTDLEDALAAELVLRCGPDTLVVAPAPDDGHPDHDALGRAAARAAEDAGCALASYLVWRWHHSTPDDLAWDRVHVVEPALPDLRTRRKAVATHRSQVLPLGPCPGDAPVVTVPVLRRAARIVEVLLADPDVLPTRARRGAEAVAHPFEVLYADGADPWEVTTSFYERRKRDLTAAVLGRERYRSVLELGCGTGILTRVLSERATHVVSVDASLTAVDRARADGPDNVTWVVGAVPAVVPDVVPDGGADLVVLSELGYFLTPTELLDTVRAVRAALADGGEIVLVDWRHPTEDIPLDGPTVHEQVLAACADLPHRAHYEDADVLVDVFGHPVSVARDEDRR